MGAQRNRAAPRAGMRETTANNAEHRWSQNARLSKLCPVCGLEAGTTYLDGKTGRQVWAHKKLVASRHTDEALKQKFRAGHPWRMSKKVMETTYHEESSALARAGDGPAGTVGGS